MSLPALVTTAGGPLLGTMELPLGEHPAVGAHAAVDYADFGGFEPFVDESAVARFLQLAPRRVLEMARNGDIPSHPIGCARKTWRFRLSEIDAYFTAQCRQSRARLGPAVPGATRRKQ